MPDNTNSNPTTPKLQNSDSPRDEIFKINVVPQTSDSDDELNDEELNDISGGIKLAADCGSGPRKCSTLCSGRIK